ncbi:MAG: biotin transporter BioY [Myxococcota bacterium]
MSAPSGGRAEILGTAVGTGLLCVLGPIELGWVEAIPISLQSLVVLAVPLALGSRVGVTCVVTYLVLGIAGLPVLAGGSSGLGKLWGSTTGFLLGFVLAAAFVGRLRDRGRVRGWIRPIAAMGAGHAVLLVPGFVWLAGWTSGQADLVGTFVGLLPGLAVKSVVGGVLVAGFDRVRA